MTFDLPKEKHTLLHIFLLIAIAYMFSIGIRLIWIDWASAFPQYMWNGHLMINTNDGYYFASSAQNALTHTYDNNPRIAPLWGSATVSITAFLSKFFPIETVIMYLPAIISSLVVIPLILLGALFKTPYFGFFAALLASIGWSYYNRTMSGYYDTDMFSAMAPMMIVYFLIATTLRENILWTLLSALSIMLYPFLYDQGLSIVYAMSIFYMAYMLFFHRKETFTYFSITVITVALFSVSPYIKIPLIALLSIAYHFQKLNFKALVTLASVFFLVFIFNENVLSLLWGKVTSYTSKGTENEALHFYQVAQTVREAGKIPFEEIANRISGNILTLFIATIGYFVLILRHRPFILALPLLGIGVFSYWGGLRFTVYAVPVAALGTVYFFYLITSTVSKKSFRYGLISIFSLFALYPNISHILSYKVPTVFNTKEVEILDRYKAVSNPRDYTIGWWDYGYGIWFYSHTNTLIDGGKHNHDNFLVSEMLTTASALESARLARISTETYVKSNYQIIADTLFYDQNHNPINVADYLDTLKLDDPVPLPPKTRDVYYYLPFRMLDIFPTVALFSNLDLNTPDNRNQSFFYLSYSMKNTEKSLSLDNGVEIVKDGNMIHAFGREYPLKKLYQVGYDQDNHLLINEQNFASEGLNVLILGSYGRVLILDDYYLNSMYIQMFIFERYDPNLFEPVILDPLTKIYRVKI